MRSTTAVRDNSAVSSDYGRFAPRLEEFGVSITLAGCLGDRSGATPGGNPVAG